MAAPRPDIVTRLGVVTVTFNSAGVLRPFLNCCIAQNYRDFLLFVIDNESRDDTANILRSCADERVVCVYNTVNLGVAEGNNQGIRLALEAKCDRVLLINNDTEFGPTLFADLAASMAHSGASAMTPRIPYHDDPSRDWFANGGFRSLITGITGAHLAWDDRLVRRPLAISYAPTCCMLINAEVFNRIGTMDERYFVYWDDTDFCWRLKRAHLRLMIDPSIVITHKVSSLTGGTESEFFIKYHYRNQIYFVRKHFGVFAVAYTAAILLAKILLRIPARGDSLRICRLRIRSLFSGFRVQLPQKLSAG